MGPSFLKMVGGTGVPLLLAVLVGLLGSTTSSASMPLPTPPLLAYQNRQVGAFIQYNIGEYGELTSNYACESGTLPPTAFAPQGTIDTDDWIETTKTFGAKVAQLTTQAGCGFLLWPSTAKHSGGPLQSQVYNQTVRESRYGGGDLVRQFVDSCRSAGVRPALYYIAGQNAYCGVKGGKVVSGGGPCGGQDDYNALVLAHLTELWANYGNLTEIWFDGGVPMSQLAPVSALVNQLQPEAVVFGGYGPGLSIRNPVRWIGTESGHAPAETWDLDTRTAGDGFGNGAGIPNGTDWVPAECDVSLLASGAWYWSSDGATPRTLTALQSIYEESVGRNCYLNLGVHPDMSGRIPLEHKQSYSAFGAWVNECYHSAPVNTTGALQAVPSGGSISLEIGAGFAVNRVVVAEDISQGQLVRSWRIDARLEGEGSGGGGGGAGWQSVAEGQSIGHKRIVPLPTAAASASALRLTILHVATSATKAQILLFEARNCSFAPPPSSHTCKTEAGKVTTGVQLGLLITGPGVDVKSCCAACWKHPDSCVGFNLATKAGVDAGKNASCQLLKTEGGEKVAPDTVTGAPSSASLSLLI